jgi:hypothetical protein
MKAIWLYWTKSRHSQGRLRSAISDEPFTRKLMAAT